MADAAGLSLGIRAQFRVYAALEAVLALLFLPMAAVSFCRGRPPPPTEEEKEDSRQSKSSPPNIAVEEAL